MPARLSALHGDITGLAVDVIVNAAKNSLMGGGGVDGAIHAAAGPELLSACRPLAPCPTGEARITPGFRLAARHVIHTVGPVWRGGSQGEASLLATCYHNSLLLADAHDLRSIAFPCISTGVYGYPPELAAPLAVAAVRDTLAHLPRIESVIFCCFSSADLALYLPLLENP